jgi:Na+/H+ antiporter NhaA
MSLFVTSLALQQDMLETTKGGVLLGSLVALVAGLVIATAPGSPRDRAGRPRP